MDKEELLKTLSFFMPRSFSADSTFLSTPDGQLTLERLLNMEKEPLSVTHLNQLLHLNHEAGLTEGFFRYYFLSIPGDHPYPVDKFWKSSALLSEFGIASLAQLEFGLTRFYADALLYWGNIRSAYRDLRTKSYEDITAYYSRKRCDSRRMEARDQVLPFHPIPV